MRFQRLVVLLSLVALSGARDLVAQQPNLPSTSESAGSKAEGASRPRLALIVSEFEYKTHDTLPAFAKANFSDDFQIESEINSDEHRQELPGIGILGDADVAILSLWRRTLPPEQLAVVREYVASGKPIVAFRATSHAFQTRDGATPEGAETWPTFDRDVLGSHYDGHHGNYAKEGFPPTHVWVLPEAKNSPLLSGVDAGEFIAPSWLYKLQPLSKGAETLMMGRVADRLPQEPVAWTYRTKHGGLVFYTSLGSPEDFELPQFRRLLRNAVYWAAERPIPTDSPK